jgi:O-antigen/teichoic acid export membrane protein
METTGIVIKKRLKKGFSANSFGFFVNLFIQVLTIPVLILYWGVDLYGEWLIISAIPAYLNFTNLGLSDAMATKMAIYVTKKKRKKALLLFQSSWRVVTLLSIVASFILILVMALAPINTIFNINQINEHDLLIIIILFAVYIIFGLQSSLLGGAYRCEGNYPEHAFIVNTTRLMESVIGLFFVSLGGGAVVLISIYAVIRIIGLVYLLFYLRNKSPWITVIGGKFDFHIVKKIINPSLASIGFSSGNMLINQGVLLMIGSFLGPASVVIFSVYRTLSRMTLKVVGIFNNIFLPEMTAAYASNKKTILRVLNRKLLGISFQLSILSLSFLILFGESIINYWTLNEIKYNNTLFLFILIETLTYLLWYAGSIPIVAINKHAKIVVLYLISSVISLIIMWFALPDMGVIAVPISLSIGNLIVGYFVIIQSIKFTEDTTSKYIKSFFKINF